MNFRFSFFLLVCVVVDAISPVKKAKESCTYLTRDGSYPPVRLDKTITSSGFSRSKQSSFYMNDQVFFAKNVLIFVGDTGTESIDMLYLKDFEKVFVPYSIYSEGWGKGFFDFSHHGTEYLEFYKAEYEVTYSSVSFLSHNISSLNSDGNNIVWSELNDVTKHYNLQLYNLNDQSLSSEFDHIYQNNDIDYIQPVVLGRYFVYIEYDHSTEESTAVLYNSMLHSSFRLKSSLTTWKTFHVQLSPINSHSYYVDYNSMDEVYCLWIATQNDVKINNNGHVELSNPTDQVKSELFVQLLEMPSLIRRKFEPGNYTFGVYTVLENVLLAGQVIFYLLKQPNTFNYMIRYYRIKDQTYTEYLTSEYPIVFVDSSLNSLLYTINTGYIHYYYLHVNTDKDHVDILPYSKCELIDILPPEYSLKEDVDSIFMYSDMVFWVTHKDNNEYYVNFIDLDKDNDEIIDAYDLFPEDGKNIYDEDNDGISDISDVWKSTGSCANDPNDKCLNDYIYLYILWAVFALIASLFTICSIWYINNKRKREEQKIPDKNAMMDKLDADGVPILAVSIETVAMSKFELTFEITILVLTVVSLVLLVAPFLDIDGFPDRVVQIFSWTDLYISTSFALDIIRRTFTQIGEGKEFIDWKHWCYNIWWEILALLTDLPGLMDTNASSVVSVLSIAKIGRFFRVFRLFKLLRIVRFYRNLTSQDKLVTLMVTHPGFYLTIFTVVFILLTAVFLKMLDQASNSVFIRIDNIIWYNIITVTTLGYGDITAVTIFARILGLIVLCIGMGVIGTISGNIATGLLAIGGMDDKIKKISVDNSNRYIAFKNMMEECWKSYNPLFHSIPFVFLTKSEWGSREMNSVTTQNISQPSFDRKSSKQYTGFGARKSTMTQSRKLSNRISAIINGGGGGGGGGGNGGAAISGGGGGGGVSATSGNTAPFAADYNNNNNNNNNGIITRYRFEFDIQEIKSLLTTPVNRDTYIHKRIDRLDKGTKNRVNSIYNEILTENDGYLEPKCALDLLLRSFKINRQYDARKYYKIVNELSDIIFCEPNQNTLYLEKIFGIIETKVNFLEKKLDTKKSYASLSRATRDNGNNAIGNVFNRLCMIDPVDKKISVVETILKKYGIMKLIDSNYLLTELHNLILRYDRMENIIWAIHNLILKGDKGDKGDKVAKLPEPIIVMSQKKRNVDPQPLPTYVTDLNQLDPFKIHVTKFNIDLNPHKQSSVSVKKDTTHKPSIMVNTSQGSRKTTMFF